MRLIQYVLLFLLQFVFSSFLLAQEEKPLVGQTATNWPGIVYQITVMQRMPNDRIFVGIRILATSQAPAGGTLLGTAPVIPKDATLADRAAGYYRPTPFSMNSSTMVEDLTQQSYPSLPPIAPPGKKYRPSVVLGILRPGQSFLAVLQFAAPPPPPPPPNGAPVKQTISFLLANAKGPISHIPLPPPDQAAAPAAN